MILCDMLYHITKYECFLMNGIIVVDFTSCYIWKNFILPEKKFNTGSYAR
jgi:hypothetical protein